MKSIFIIFSTLYFDNIFSQTIQQTLLSIIVEQHIFVEYINTRYLSGTIYIERNCASRKDPLVSYTYSIIITDIF